MNRHHPTTTRKPQYTVRTTKGTEMTVFQPNDGTAAANPARGETVWLSWDAAHSYLLTTAPAPTPAAPAADAGSLTPR